MSATKGTPDPSDDESQRRRRQKRMSERQSAANRENATKSTGPRTPEGKARSSANATRHGGWSTRLIAIQTGALKEDPEELAFFVEGIMVGLDPRDFVEKEAAKRIALMYLRLDRTDRLESELLEAAGDTSRDNELMNASRMARNRALEEVKTTDATRATPYRGSSVPWIGDDAALAATFRAARATLDCIREPDRFFETPTSEIDWESMALLLKFRHPRGPAIRLPGTWDHTHEPVGSEEWHQAFDALRDTIWATDTEAIGWLKWFIGRELIEFGRITGSGLRAAADRAVDQIERVGRIRTAATRELHAHFMIYNQLRSRP